MAKQPKGELVVVEAAFDYGVLESEIAERVRTAAESIRDKLKKTLEDIIGVGNDLLAVQESLPHGQFLRWLRAEFDWQQRTAYNFISVAQRFKVATVASLPIQPTAAYLLAAPSVPDEARQVAIEKAEAGEEITFVAAKGIVAEARKKRKKKAKPVSADKLGERLVKVLERYRERWTGDVAELARQLREFADALDMRGKKKAKG